MKARRLDWTLAQRGAGTRKQIQKLIKSRRVAVNGQLTTDPKAKVYENQCITIDGNNIENMPLLLVWHKPVNVVSTMKDPFGRSDLSGVIPDSFQGRFHPVGRLDGDTSGLLLFSRSGSLTQWFLHPKRTVRRWYKASVDGRPDASLSETLASGVDTSLGRFPANVDRLVSNDIFLSVTEGKHRMVRRILANSGHPVIHLHRYQYGPIKLGELKRETYRPVSDDEMIALSRLGAPI